MNTATQTENNLPMVLYPEIQEIIHRLFEIQSKGKATVFLEIMGHVQGMRVRVFNHSWHADADPDFYEEIYIEPDGSESIRVLKESLFRHLDTL